MFCSYRGYGKSQQARPDERGLKLDAEAGLRALPASVAPAFASLATLRLDLMRRARGRDMAPLWRRQLALWLWMRRR